MQTLARMETSEVGRILLFSIERETALRDRALHRRPRYDSENIREDARHKLGEIDGLEFLNKLHRAAQDACGIARPQDDDKEE